MPTVQVRCDCGGELPRPIPQTCPHCRRPIVAIRHRHGPFLAAALGVVVLFGVLAAAWWWLVRNG